ncbi:MAG: glutaredoxin family protein [Gammaproteobacteria bacterium]|nr:glutaredoxin family protein [Gammaproteobacteria bacterium]
MTGAVEILFYYREDCHLCENMRRDLEVFRRQHQAACPTVVTMRDIEDDARWLERYHEYVPVLVVDGEEVCHYFFDSGEMRNAINQCEPGHAKTPG